MHTSYPRLWRWLLLHTLGLLCTLAIPVTCRAVLGNSSYSTDEPSDALFPDSHTVGQRLARRVIPFGTQQVDIPGTGFRATLNIKNYLLTAQPNTAQALARKIHSDAQNLNPAENLGQAYNVWPAPDRIVKFELRRLQPKIRVPLLGRQLLEGISQMIENTFIGSSDSFHFHDFDGSITCFGQETFSFRAITLPGDVVRSEKLHGVDFGEQDLDAIFKIKLTLLSLTTQDDLLIFVGNTGRYFVPAFSTADPVSYRRKVAFIPVSGLGGSWISMWRSSGLATSTTAGEKNFANTVLKPIFTDPKLMPATTGRIVFVDHARTGRSIDILSQEIQSGGFVPFNDPRLWFINLLYKAKHEAPVALLGPALLANIPVDDAQMARFDLGTVGRVTPWYCSLYWEDGWEIIPYPDKPAAQAILDQIRERAVLWAKQPPPIPAPGPGIPNIGGPARVPPPSPFARGPRISPFEAARSQRLAQALAQAPAPAPRPPSDLKPLRPS